MFRKQQAPRMDLKLTRFRLLLAIPFLIALLVLGRYLLMRSSIARRCRLRGSTELA